MGSIFKKKYYVLAKEAAMRKFYTLMTLLLCATVLSGCMRFTTTVKVKSNGKVDISMLYAISKGLAEMGDEDINMTLPEEEVTEMEDNGWTCKEYYQEDYVGYEMVKENVDLNDLANEFGDSDREAAINPDQLKVQRNGFTYIIDWKMFEDEQQEQLSEYKNYFSMAGGYMEFVLELPFKASNSNATYVSDDGKTLKWDLLSMPKEGMHVEFSLLNIPLVIGCIVGCAVLVAIVVVVIAVMANKKKKEAYAWQQMEYPGMPQAGTLGMPQTGDSGMSQAGNPGMPQAGNFGMSQVGQDASMNRQPALQSPSIQRENVVEQPQNAVEQPENLVNQQQNLSVADEIMKLKNLMESGVITAEEFEVQKKKLLGE